MKATAQRQAAPMFIRRQIGNTTYNVNIHFSQTCQETASDKIVRLLKHDLEVMYEEADEDNGFI